jgi:class 3 adenylate cyclase
LKAVEYVMRMMPSGTLTLLFSDIEGSTVLLGRLGPAYGDALKAQRRILRAAWAAHRGTEVGTEGDSFFVVFETAQDAVLAAVEAQREVAELTLPDGGRMRIGMGITPAHPRFRTATTSAWMCTGAHGWPAPPTAARSSYRMRPPTF